MIHEEICTYEVCKLAKEKGFPQQYDSLTHIYGGKDSFNVGIDLKYKKCEGTLFDISEWNPCLNDIAAPTQSLLQRWLREEKGYYVYPYYDNNEFKWTYSIREKTGDMWILLVGETPNFDKYEEAMEAGLKFVLENLV